MDEMNRVLSLAAAKKRVMCVGNATMDCISIVKRFPKLSKTEKSGVGYCQRGGNASNICTILRNLGVDVEFFGVLCSSPMCASIKRDMTARGIKSHHCPQCMEDPPFSSVVVNQRTRTTHVVACNKSFPYPTMEDFEKLDLSTYGWIHFRGCRPEITIQMMRAVDAYNQTQSDKIIISMDFDMDLTANWPLVDYCDYVFFYKALAEETGWKSAREGCVDIDQMLRLRFGINMKRPFVVFIWSIQKIGLMDLDGNYIRTTSYKPTRFVDNLGAMEVVVSGFIYGLYVRGRSPRVAADFASLIANYKCTKYGFDHIPNILEVPDL
ncbi:hypothetical protein AWZ03_003976 [Drosophila navojoa]|uniref:Carbohydrate kinase PfkB domain-containing protein n=1 Tax=Drosophila navojoa TaxID=7232 RepID=A0A484BLX5_DRONA|nr:ketohexokinase [Drosophila navojoa]TDG49738.1 hypothetical protein AWZ03_003976 [Drosophila navojoa]